MDEKVIVFIKNVQTRNDDKAHKKSSSDQDDMSTSCTVSSSMSTTSGLIGKPQSPPFSFEMKMRQAIGSISSTVRKQKKRSPVYDKVKDDVRTNTKKDKKSNIYLQFDDDDDTSLEKSVDDFLADDECNQIDEVDELHMNEIFGECFAPPGKLGVAIDSVNGVPVVHKVKMGSPLEGILCNLDRIVAIDNVDTRNMSGADVTKLMVSGMKKVRKISFVRGGTFGKYRDEIDDIAI